MESPVEFGKAWALVKRDILNWSSYRSQVITSVFGAIIGIATWGAMGTFNSAVVPQYGVNYVTFLVSGILLSNIIVPISSGVSSRLAPWSIETLLMTGISAPTYVLGTIGWAYILSIVFIIPQLAFILFIFPVQFHVDPISLVVAIGISGAIMFSLGMISSGIKLVTKVTDPVSWFLGVAQGLFAGMTFPISHLNSLYPGLSTASWFIPQTYIYNTVRLSILSDSSLADPSVAQAFLAAGVVALILIPLGVYSFQWGLRRAKREGNIGWF
jgi:ABC-2 type transport system permease protein